MKKPYKTIGPKELEKLIGRRAGIFELKKEGNRHFRVLWEGIIDIVEGNQDGEFAILGIEKPDKIVETKSFVRVMSGDSCYKPNQKRIIKHGMNIYVKEWGRHIPGFYFYLDD